MNHNLTFQRTLVSSLKSKIAVEKWDKVLETYDSKNFKETIRNCISFIDPTIETKFANEDKTAYSIPHGSILVHIKITDDTFYITAPFLSIENSKKIPLLRQVAQLNFTPLTLSRIELEDNNLYFKYNCSLDVCEPYKIYDVFREICINADNYDDEFIAKFDAKRIQAPLITPYSTEQKELAWNLMQQYISEAFNVYEQLENKRLTAFLWDILIITLLKIDYTFSPQGILRNEIEKAIVHLNSKEDYYQRLSDAKAFLKKLQSYDKLKFEDDLYQMDVFVHYKYRTDLEMVKNNLKNSYETADKELKALDNLGALFTLEYGILNLFYNNILDDTITEILTKAMENAAKKPIPNAVKILVEAYEKIMNTADFSASENNSNIENTKEIKKDFLVNYLAKINCAN